MLVYERVGERKREEVSVEGGQTIDRWIWDSRCACVHNWMKGGQCRQVQRNIFPMAHLPLLGSHFDASWRKRNANKCILLQHLTLSYFNHVHTDCPLLPWETGKISKNISTVNERCPLTMEYFISVSKLNQTICRHRCLPFLKQLSEIPFLCATNISHTKIKVS
jgi:hypothetical protein